MIAGRYSLDREIGRGGMGTVWLAEDEVLGRQVALKRIGLLPGADSTDLARAEREARLTARLNHPHVVAVFNFVVDDDSQACWLVMEYVEGTNLSQLVRDRGGLPPEEASALLVQVADALVAAHAAGIVHRDVKPSNILVDLDGRVKLADFGIARIAADPSLTQTGLVTGSPAYLAPEVAAGGRGDEAVDVWSLGATLFFVLSGHPPYEMGDHPLGGLYRIVHEDPPRLPGAGWMAPLLEATMVKDPALRWSMRQVRDFLAEPGNRTLPRTPAPLPAPVPAPAPAGTAAPTRVLGAAGGDDPPPPAVPPSAPPTRPTRTREIAVLVGVALSVVLALVLFTVLHDPAPTSGQASGPASQRPTAATSSTASSPTPSPTARTSHPPARPHPTASGMRSFIRSYVAAVGSDPDTAWQMLTPKFQRQSGGLRTYRDFWRGVGAGRVRDIAVDPRNLVVSYRVRFDHFGTGRRPTVLTLAFDGDRYRIDGEHTPGFVPAG